MRPHARITRPRTRQLSTLMAALALVGLSTRAHGLSAAREASQAPVAEVAAGSQAEIVSAGGDMVWRNLIVEAPARQPSEPMKAEVGECRVAADCGERGPELGHFACVAQHCVEVEPAAAPYFSDQGLGVAGVETVPPRGR